MLTHPTLQKLQALKLFAFAQALARQRESTQYAALSFEERLGLLVDVEWMAREQRALARRLRQAQLRGTDSLENVDYDRPRGLNRAVVLSLGTGAWLRAHENVVLTGPSGIGKTFLVRACVESACRQGFTAIYYRAPRLFHELAVSRGDGSYTRLLARLAKVDLLAIDDWLLTPLAETERRDILEVVEDRVDQRSTLVAGQLPVLDWHAAIGDPTLADAICERLLHHAHRIALTGPTMRDLRDLATAPPPDTAP